MLSTGSVILSMIEVICYTLSMTILTFRFCTKSSIQKFAFYLFALVLFCSICFVIDPHFCIVVMMLVVAVLISRENKDFLFGYYMSAFSASIVMYVNIASTVLYHISEPFRSFLISYPFMIHLLGLLTCFALSFFLNKNIISFKSRHNILILSVYNTIALVGYLIFLPMFFSYDDYTNLLVLVSTFVLVSSVLNIGLAFIINRNEAREMLDESEQKLMDMKHETAIRNYNEAIVYKYAFSSRYSALAYYIHKEDFSGLKEYVAKYIQPTHTAHMVNEKILVELEKIHDEPIRNSIFSLYDKCCLFGKKIRLYVFSNTDRINTITDLLRTDFIAIIEIFCEIAFTEVRDLEDAEIQVSITQTDQLLTINFKNTYGNIDNEINLKAYELPLDTHYRDELTILDKLGQKYKNAAIIRTEKQDHMLLQEIEIDKRKPEW